jgi:hypothetical protein
METGEILTLKILVVTRLHVPPALTISNATFYICVFIMIRGVNMDHFVNSCNNLMFVTGSVVFTSKFRQNS